MTVRLTADSFHGIYFGKQQAWEVWSCEYFGIFVVLSALIKVGTCDVPTVNTWSLLNDLLFVFSRYEKSKRAYLFINLQPSGAQWGVLAKHAGARDFAYETKS